MKGILPVKALSLNTAYRGRRFKTKECTQYCKAVSLMLPSIKCPSEYYEVRFKFHLKNFAMTDEDNLVKILQDCMVDKGMIIDDRRIVKHVLEKYPSDIDWIEWEVLPMTKPSKQEITK